MNIASIKLVTRELGKTLNRNSPSILMGFGIAGFISSVVLAIKATPKALALIDDEIYQRYLEETDGGNISFGEFLKVSDQQGYSVYSRLNLLTFREKAELTWQCYLPTLGLSTVSATMIILANHMNLRRNAILASLYSIAEGSFREYQQNVVDELGKHKDEQLRGGLAQKKLDDNPVEEHQVILTGKGTQLCYEVLSGRYFQSDIETLRQIQNDFNETLISEMTMTLNELYLEMGLETNELGTKAGFTLEKGLLEFTFSAKIATNGQPCVVVDYNRSPEALWF